MAVLRDGTRAISSQLPATSGNYSAQLPVLEGWSDDLQTAQQEAQNDAGATRTIPGGPALSC
jgi:hypothetical protein